MTNKRGQQHKMAAWVVTWQQAYTSPANDYLLPGELSGAIALASKDDARVAVALLEKNGVQDHQGFHNKVKVRMEQLAVPHVKVLHEIPRWMRKEGVPI